MENNTDKELKKVVDALSVFTEFAAEMLNSVVDKAPKEEREKLKGQVEKLKKGGLANINKEIKNAEDLLNNLPE